MNKVSVERTSNGSLYLWLEEESMQVESFINKKFLLLKKVWEAEATKGDTAMKQETLLKQI